MSRPQHLAPGSLIAILAAVYLAADWTVLAAAAEKVARPSDAAVEKELTRIRNLYKSELRRSEETKLREVTVKLIAAAGEESNSTVRYALLELARETAADAGELRLAWRAVRRLIAGYRIDPFKTKHETLLALLPNSRTPGKAGRLTEVALDLAESAVLEDKHAFARKVLAKFLSSALRSKDPRLVSAIRSLQNYVKETEAKYAEIEGAITTLLQAPKDPAANLALGHFACLYKGDWKSGLSHLAKGSDPRLCELAKTDLAGADDSAGQRRLAEAWHEYAAESKGFVKQYALTRAAYWWQKSYRELTGLRQKEIAMQLQQLSARLEPHLPNVKGRLAVSCEGRPARVVVHGYKYDGTRPLTVEVVVKPYTDKGNRSSDTVIGTAERSGWCLARNNANWAFSFHDKKKYQSVWSRARTKAYKTVHLAGVFDGETIALFVDGALQGRKRVNGHRPSRYPLLIGADPGRRGAIQHSFLGTVDDVRISRVARYTKSFKVPRVLFPDPDTVVLLNFDRVTDNKSADLSGNGHDGELKGAKVVWFR